ncbi:MAG: folylpolyglutamate synthase/dihydrofolate synthase family protein [Campylobacterales bacterium]
MNLVSFLDAKGVEYAPFDPNRFKNFIASHPDFLSAAPRIVQIVGTNGKGTTGRFLAEILKNGGLKVGHFTSPHILSFTERFWFDGQDANEDELETAFEAMHVRFKDELGPLSYFEILTLLACFYFKDRAEIVVMEAGVGGEYDSTSALSKELLLVTPISMDHLDMLGSSIEEITRTKLRASNCKTIVGFQPHRTVKEVIKTEFLSSDISFLEDLLSAEEMLFIEDYIANNSYASYLSQNLALAYAASKSLGINPALENIKPLKGRFERIEPNVILDVGHNVDAARRVAEELGGKKVVLVFNCYADKDPENSLLALKNNIEIVEIIDVENERLIKKDKLIKVLDKIKVPYRNFDKIDKNSDYLVFGSFSVAAEFLRRRFEKKI